MKIEWTKPSLVDLESIRDFIKRDSEYYAYRFVGKIIDAVEILENFPEMGRIVPEASDKNIREILFANYRIMYRIEKDRILILTVMHGSQSLDQKEFKPWYIT